jgi:sortase A
MARALARAAEVVGVVVAPLLLLGCAGAEGESLRGSPSPAPDRDAPRAASPHLADSTPSRSPAPADPEPSAGSGSQPPPPREPRRSQLSIPALGLRSVPVVRYVGSPDDAEGTRIQDDGPTASPRGRDGGVGPGEVGNFILTGHRTSHAAPFRDLPALGVGDRVRVRSGSTVYVYRIVATRSTSFRSPRSLAEQSAAVPGRPGAEPTRPMITLSTCATLEDHAAGNYWSDRFGNPEHRIDKVGVLVTQLPAGA